MTKPTPEQRVILRVLAHGGWLTEGVPGRSSPRLWASDGRLWSLVSRQSLQALQRRGWLNHDGTVREQAVYSVTPAGRAVIRSARP